MMEVDDQSFETEVLKSPGLVLVDFWAPWCGPCKSLAPVLDNLAGKVDNLKIRKVNVDENSVYAQKYGVRSIPALFLFKEGKLVSQKNGLQTESQLVAWVSDNQS